MAYSAIITPLKNVRAHSNADRLLLATVVGEQVIVGLDSKDGDIGVFFPIDGQLTPDFLKAMNLYRKNEMNSDPNETGMFDENGRVRAQVFRGEKSEGFWMPLSVVQKKFTNVPTESGTEFTDINGLVICQKYIPKNIKTPGNTQPTAGKARKFESKMLLEHFDTGQLGRNSHRLKINERVVITEKVHGTSQRTGNVLVKRAETLSRWHTFLGWLGGCGLDRNIIMDDYETVTGTRRTVMDPQKENPNPFHEPKMRELAAANFADLRKGETVYYELVGYEYGDKCIMPGHDNQSLKNHLDKNDFANFINTYGERTDFTYGCAPGTFDVYVYRITYTNEDGYSVDLNWDALVARCKELGVKHVPVLFDGTLSDFFKADTNYLDNSQTWSEEEKMDYAIELVRKWINLYCNNKFLNGREHALEGVCIRAERENVPLILKEKSFIFKCLEGIIKDSGVLDIEEAEATAIAE